MNASFSSRAAGSRNAGVRAAATGVKGTDVLTLTHESSSKLSPALTLSGTNQHDLYSWTGFFFFWFWLCFSETPILAEGMVSLVQWLGLFLVWFCFGAIVSP